MWTLISCFSCFSYSHSTWESLQQKKPILHSKPKTKNDLSVMLWARFVFSRQCCVMALSLCIVCTKITKHTLTFPFWTLGVCRRESTADRPQNIRRPVETVISSYARVMLLNRSTRYICCVYYSINHLTPTQSRYFQAKFKIELYML